MTYDQWIASVGVLTYRQYSAEEGQMMLELAADRIGRDLRSPWNQVAFQTQTDAEGLVALPNAARGLRSVWVTTDGLPMRMLTAGGPALANEYLARGFLPEHSPLGAVAGAPLAFHVIGTNQGQRWIQLVPIAANVPVLVSYYGLSEGSNGLEIADHMPAVWYWAGAVEGFQLQGDEAGRERALRTFAIELDRVNEEGAGFDFTDGGAQVGI